MDKMQSKQYIFREETLTHNTLSSEAVWYALKSIVVIADLVIAVVFVVVVMKILVSS